MDNLIIDRGAQCCRENQTTNSITFEGWFSTVVPDVLFCNLVQLIRGHPGGDVGGHLTKRPADEVCGGPQAINLLIVFQVDHDERDGIRCLATSADAAGLHEAIVVTHQEMAFDLLQRVEGDTDKNQK